MTVNIAHSRFGRALIAVRDADVAAEATGISKPRLLVTVFLFSGARRGHRRRTVRHPADLHHAGRLHLRPVGAVLHRGADRRARLDPRPAARHHHPDAAAGIRRAARGLVDLPLRGRCCWSIVLVAPGGIAALLDFRSRKPLQKQPRDRSAPGAARRPARPGTGERRAIALRGIVLSFGGVRAIDGRRPRRQAGPDPRADRAERQRQDDDPERHLRLLPAGDRATMRSAPRRCRRRAGNARAARHRADLPDAAHHRRSLGAAERHDRRHDPAARRRSSSRCSACRAIGATKRCCEADALAALRAVGLEGLADVRADRLQHSELRFIEIARALMLRPDFLLLDEPAAGPRRRRDPAARRPDQGDQPARHRRAAGRASCRPDLRHLRPRHRAQSRPRARDAARRRRSACTRRWSVPISAAEPLLDVHGAQSRLRQDRRAARRRPDRRRRRGRRPARSQRRRQDHAAARRVRPAALERRRASASTAATSQASARARRRARAWRMSSRAIASSPSSR